MKFAQKFSTQEWDLFTFDLIKQKYTTSIGDLASKLNDFKGINLKEQEKQDIWDTFKVSIGESNLPLNQR